MTQGSLRRTVMYLMLFGHIAAMLLAPIMIRNFGEALNISITLLPVTAAIVMFIVQFHQENFYGTKTDDMMVSRDAASLTIILSVLLIFSIVGMIFLYYIGTIPTIELLQRSVNVTDTGIIVYLILLLRRLFERQSS